MAKKVTKVKILISFCGFLLLFYVFIFCSYGRKNVHLSFDDVSICMKELTEDSVAYSSIFQQPFFKKLQFLHECCGAKFTLYIYEKDGSYTIDKFPSKFAQELKENRNWLMFGYHAQSPADSITQSKLFIEAYNDVDSNLNVKFGGVIQEL